MMPIRSIDNDQNIERPDTKMSDHYSDQNNANLLLSGSVDAVVSDFFDFNGSKDSDVHLEEDLALGYDHMYASNFVTENGDVNLTDTNCQSAESEVKFWKEWLILHLDLIQQQSDEILDKERTILILQQENEMLKERISCMERGAPFQPSKYYNYNHAAPFLDDNMTQDSAVCEEDTKSCIELLECRRNGDNCPPTTAGNEEVVDSSKPIINFLEIQPQPPPPLQYINNINTMAAISDTESQTDNNHGIKGNGLITYMNLEELNHDMVLKTENDCGNSEMTGNDFSFDINSSGEFDPMRNLRLSIRRKRLSNSSAVSNNDSAGPEEKRPFQTFRKRRKRVVKDPQALILTDQYVTQAGETNLGISTISDVPVEITNDTTLEVPRWRIKVYGSCYTLEGTENLDDEVYNKRHNRLENDERRRKRWDVQRIREQRVVEKLRQRQERIGSGSKTDDPSDALHSLWPKLDDVRVLEITEQLPVSAFGCPVPKLPPSEFSSEFSLPWLNNPSLFVPKKAPAKRSTGRRKNKR